MARRQEGTAWTDYPYDGEGPHVEKQSSTGGRLIYVYTAFGELAAEYGSTPGVTGPLYLSADHLGSTRLVTKQDESVSSRPDYLPFGGGGSEWESFGGWLWRWVYAAEVYG